MRPKTNRLLLLLVSAAIAGCASQTDRSSSGGGDQTQIEHERVGGSSNAVTQEELERRAAAKAAAEQVAVPAAPPAPAYEPEKEAVQYVDRPLEETPPPKPAAVAAAPKDEATPDFPISKYELPEEAAKDEEVEDLGPQDDESVSAEQEAAPAAESSVGETTEYSDEQETADSAEVEDLGTQPDDSGTVSFPEEKRASADNVVSEPKIYPDEPAPKAATGAPKSVSINFETEPLFNFDKSEVRADQRAKLDEFISRLGGTQYDSIAVVGHTDRIGKDAYNQKLSERRAAAVKAYLVKKGVPSDKIQSEGHGKSEPVTGDACAKARGKALISCLQPDRRVDVSVSATKPSN